MRTSPLVVLATALMLASAPIAHVEAVVVKPPPPLDAAPWADSSNQDTEAAQMAIASALIAVAGRRLPDQRGIELRIDRSRIVEVSPRDRSATGHGQLRLGNDGDWLSFRYRALYDSEAASVAWAELAFGLDDEGGQLLDADAADTRELRQQALQRIRDEFPQQTVELNFSELRQLPNQGRYRRYVGWATARFDGQHDSNARVDGLYDTTAKHWLDVHYELGELDRWRPALADTTSR